MNLTDFFQISRTGSGVYLPSTVTTSNYGFCNGNPWIVVAEDELWSDDWKKGFYPEGKVFCYFGPAWLVNFSMAADTEGSIGYEGGWGATEGPQGFFWGGTWICAAEGTDNASLVKDIMYQMTCKEDVMTEIVKDDDDFVNNKPRTQ